MEETRKFNYTLNLKLQTDRIFFGPGVVELLQLISKTGSLNTAAKKMGMSYNKAWRIIKKAEEEYGSPLVIKSVGGNKGGGSTVTEDGEKLTAQFLYFQKKTYQITNQLFNEIFFEGTSNELN
ncbi:winged helix-turn-helix domain-containing protein [Enterococcus rivorum]|uniref:LysR family transcriptional regulator n=1 Tax=Enterococcus rivorum TaxID=762845 RepID=A0A1E5KTI7_9ENTE|nr:LysR family transcriptional regulator [Enterococcus rivorum]OEH81212.1 LysR family transcriptional regulator [Enterococcus rivorum]